MIKSIFIIFFSVFLSFSLNAQSLKSLKNTALKIKKDLVNNSSNVSSISENEAARALREALDNGIKNSVDLVSKEDGYLNNPEINIPFPPDAKRVEDRLRKLGMNILVDDAILYINKAAEEAAVAAKHFYDEDYPLLKIHLR